MIAVAEPAVGDRGSHACGQVAERVHADVATTPQHGSGQAGSGELRAGDDADRSAKAIVALGAFAQLAQMRGQKESARSFGTVAREFASRWVKEADDGDHFRLAFDRTQAKGSFKMMQNDVERAEHILNGCSAEQRANWEWRYVYRLCHPEQMAIKLPPQVNGVVQRRPTFGQVCRAAGDQKRPGRH